jgi:anaerobic magnesium-protoporphyrin IX monomethyl ester cyclase
MKTVLTTAPVSRGARYTTGLEKIANVKPPLGLAYLASALEQNNMSVDIVDAEAFQISAEELLDKVAALRPDILGMSCMTMGYAALSKFAQRFKEKCPSCLIVMGGPHASIFPEKTLVEQPAIDVVAVGEAEHTLVELVDAHQRGSGFEAIDGIAFRNEGRIILTQKRKMETDLDKIPYPAWHKLPVTRYNVAPQWEKRAPTLTMITGRGCPFKCTFCSRAVFGNTLRRRSPGSVIDEMKYFKAKLGIKDVAFADDIFTLSRSWLSTFCELMMTEKVGLSWSCQARVDSVTREMLEQMSKAGCWNIFFGIESGNQAILDRLCKGIKLEQAKQSVKWAKQAGLEVQTSFMLALPGESPEIAMETIRFAIELDPDYAKFNITAPFPGTELYEQACEAGVVVENLDRFTTSIRYLCPSATAMVNRFLRSRERLSGNSTCVPNTF